MTNNIFLERIFHMTTFKKIGVLTSGGDAPGMNAAVRAVVRSAIANGVEVLGIYRGYSGLIDGDIKPLRIRDVSNIINKGGTMLYSDRCLEFQTPAGMAKAVETCKKLGIDGIVALGGDGTFRGATALTAHGIPCIGIPCTIDNDIASTDNTIGFDTAMNTVIELVDKLRDTCESHARCNVVEVMGRDAGDIAINTGIASGATAVIIPEIEFDENALLEKIKTSRNLGKRNFIVIVSEGLGSSFSPDLAKKIQAVTGVETKFARLAHVVRGGNPTLRDRVLASRMGMFAVEQLLAGKSNLVVCELGGVITTLDINYALTVDKIKKHTVTEEELASYDEKTREEMYAFVDAQMKKLNRLYEVESTINL